MNSKEEYDTKPNIAGFEFIKDTGRCSDHGYFLPKQNAAAMPCISNAGVDVADVSVGDLCKVLEVLENRHVALTDELVDAARLGSSC